MKYVLLSADNTPSIYSVPDVVADNLGQYCYEFCRVWLHTSPDAEEYRMDTGDGVMGVCYDERDFIKYLNICVFPDNPSHFIETLDKGISPKYKDCEQFNF